MDGFSTEQNGHSPSAISTSNGHSNGNGHDTGTSTSHVPGAGGGIGVGGGVATPLGADKRGDNSPSASVSDGGGAKQEGPQDMAAEKVGFSEDLRALKVLDRNFR